MLYEPSATVLRDDESDDDGNEEGVGHREEVQFSWKRLELKSCAGLLGIILSSSWIKSRVKMDDSMQFRWSGWGHRYRKVKIVRPLGVLGLHEEALPGAVSVVALGCSHHLPRSHWER